VLNCQADLANNFMHDVFQQLSVRPSASVSRKMCTPDMIITTSDFNPEEYGADFVMTYMKRIGVDPSGPVLPTMHFISSTTMCPWLTATAEGNFIPKLIEAFRAAVAAVLSKYQSTSCTPRQPAWGLRIPGLVGSHELNVYTPAIVTA
jgi:hypothetical protein